MFSIRQTMNWMMAIKPKTTTPPPPTAAPDGVLFRENPYFSWDKDETFLGEQEQKHNDDDDENDHDEKKNVQYDNGSADLTVDDDDDDDYDDGDNKRVEGGREELLGSSTMFETRIVCTPVRSSERNRQKRKDSGGSGKTDRHLLSPSDVQNLAKALAKLLVSDDVDVLATNGQSKGFEDAIQHGMKDNKTIENEKHKNDDYENNISNNKDTFDNDNGDGSRFDLVVGEKKGQSVSVRRSCRLTVAA